MWPFLRMRSDGNGGTQLDKKPNVVRWTQFGWTVLVFLVGAGVSWGIQTEKVSALEKGRAENRAIIDMHTEAISDIKVCVAEVKTQLVDQKELMKEISRELRRR